MEAIIFYHNKNAPKNYQLLKQKYLVLDIDTIYFYLEFYLF